MFDDEGTAGRGGRLARLADDPPGLRRAGRLALGALVAIVVASRLLPEDLTNLGNLLLALAWVAGPLVALGIGFGEAFFIRHGRGGRRAALTALGALAVALVACAGLAVAGLGRVVAAGLHGALYGAAVLLLAALIGWGIGRGASYLADRIDALSDDEW